jgi:hypothetical protein
MFSFLKRANEHPDQVTGKTQKQMILSHLASGKTLTQLEAIHLYGILALSQRVGELKREGVSIKTDTARSGSKSWAVYRLESHP